MGHPPFAIIFILCFIFSPPLHSESAFKSFFGKKLYRASIRDSVSLTSATLFSGPVGSVSARALDSGCTLLDRGDAFVFFACREGAFRFVFQSRSSGTLETDTLTVEVTDEPPVLSFGLRSAEAEFNRPFSFDFTAGDDGDSFKITADLDGDGTVDAVSTGESRPLYRFTRPTLSGERERLFMSRFTLTDNDGHTVTDSATLRLRYQPPRAKAGDNAIHCPGVYLPFSGAACRDANADGYVKRYFWDFDGDGRTDTATALPDVEWVYQKPGDYCLVLIVADNDGNRSAPDTAYVTVLRPRPLPAVSGPHTARCGAPLVLFGSAQASCAQVDRFFWDFDGDGAWDFQSRSLGRAEYTFRKPGAYNARFLVVDDRNDSAQIFWPVSVAP